MASTITADNGVSSGSAGLKSAADSTGILALRTTTAGGTATTAATISTTQVVDFVNTPTVNGTPLSVGSAGFNGATVTTSAVDITLTSASTQTQVVSMTAAGKFVNLPNATTLSTKGGPIFIIQNKGQNPFGVKDAAGNVVTPMLYYGQSVSLVLLTNSASAGSWGSQILGAAGLAGMGPINASSISVYQTGTCTTCGLSSTQALIAFQATSGRFDVVLATISGSTVTYGTPTTLLSTTAGNVYATVSLSSSLAVFVVTNSSSIPQLIAVSVSGSTVTVGTAVALATSAVTGYTYSAFQESATAGAVTYAVDNGSSMSLNIRGFTVSGTTITLGTNQYLTTATGGTSVNCSTAKLATGSYVSIYYESATPACYARPWTSSAGTVTLGTQTTYASTTYQYTIISSASASQIGFGASSTCGFFANSAYNVTAVISGTAISSLTVQYVYPTPFSGFNASPFTGVSPFGSNAVFTLASVGTINAHTGSANGFGGSVSIGTLGLSGTSLSSYSYCDSTTNIFAGVYNGLIGAVVVKGN